MSDLPKCFIESKEGKLLALCSQLVAYLYLIEREDRISAPDADTLRKLIERIQIEVMKG